MSLKNILVFLLRSFYEYGIMLNFLFNTGFGFDIFRNINSCVRPQRPMADPNMVSEAAKWIVNAQRPLVIIGKGMRNN